MIASDSHNLRTMVKLDIAVAALKEIARIYDEEHNLAFASSECEDMADAAKEALKKIT